MSTRPVDAGAIDARLDSARREGLAGTTPANVYVPPATEQISVAPDFQPPDAQPAWRQDFPIDWPVDQHVERRDFLKFLVLTSAAMTAGQIWIAVQAWLHRRADVLPARRIASLDDLAVGGVLAFTYPTEHDPCLLIRVGESDLVAYSQKCTHLSCAVVPRPEEGILHCPCHNGAFALDDGRPIAGPPSRPLPAVQLEVRGRDVYAVGVTVRTV